LSDVETEVLASTIRNEILETTGCSASAGIGGTMLMARLATRVAKPAGQLYISAEKVLTAFYKQLSIFWYMCLFLTRNQWKEVYEQWLLVSFLIAESILYKFRLADSVCHFCR